MTLNKLHSQINKKKSFLCVGLDVDLEKIPAHLLNEEDPIFAFSKAIISFPNLLKSAERIEGDILITEFIFIFIF